MKNDKETKFLRYDARAQSLLLAGSSAFESEPSFGSLASPPILRTPYLYYEQCIRQHISKDQDVGTSGFSKCCFREIIYQLLNGSIYVANSFVDNFSLNTGNNSHYHTGNKGMALGAVAEN